MKAIDLNHFLCTLFPALPKPTVDRVTAGDPDRVVKKIAVCWMPFRQAILKAKKACANVIVTHEPIFFEHWDLDGESKDHPETASKLRFIEELGITIIRCHDVWDRMPEIGIPFAWAKFLGLTDLVASNQFNRVYAIKTQTALAFARYLGNRIKNLGQAYVPFYGDPKKRIKTIGIGTGCTDPMNTLALGPDAVVAVDDAVRSWIAGSFAESAGTPVYVVNHGVSEEPGMATLTAFLKKHFPKIPVTHIRQGCSYRTLWPRG
ncbi:MAG: hypothetical protein A2487_15170 [Candidatus Raymondbacteria bacterium RifOxyC12_full_50_8]|uniref:NGG1p interacting factor NIF3 n=1 Tax=Candidatus Raymondbacteria bacterium RIFOXYD12_FULL_49_13 TaxID=1817890 RepID=A0A1F7FJY5_UNCRA|nr:MAG: hypothetical protein A2248_09390 [Candidatus Raymondbacteria bacterium RIFOXYA2_FULL_49_16]OGJ96354.1 MAG: hypothetical protein A2453_08500 [Candidatus Raymondbacteria bacterium RIFOXYC2_FULL_50_21]OGK03711.1 MAG: hypothetical protein A2487_15170 [Candidatus Raymondbacteria bacterium RifOxyC12_full_50_8]OGK06891.1 MAG: hypothetical protein A2519_11570 [Candidatus Raymondbacteria bacterium RIFOXYD12_FULL_49_13]OGP44046.1 MAG: hypothetical protein A2324_14160 [Candidatus Raymondbacteria b